MSVAAMTVLRQRDQDRNLALEVVPFPVAARCSHEGRRNGSARLLIGVGILAAGEGAWQNDFWQPPQSDVPLLCPSFFGARGRFSLPSAYESEGRTFEVPARHLLLGRNTNAMLTPIDECCAIVARSGRHA
jgi:hypothetical protein